MTQTVATNESNKNVRVPKRELVLKNLPDDDLVALLAGLEVLLTQQLSDDHSFDQLEEHSEAAYRVAMQEAVRRAIVQGHAIVITNECGDPEATIRELAEYALPVGDDDAIVEPRGFRVIWADGHGNGEPITEYLDSRQNFLGVGSGPWDGQFYTIECCGAHGAAGIAKALTPAE